MWKGLNCSLQIGEIGGRRDDRRWWSDGAAFISRFLRTEHWRRRCSPGHRRGCWARCTWSCGWCSTQPARAAAPCAAPPLWCNSGERREVWFIERIIFKPNTLAFPHTPNFAAYILFVLNSSTLSHQCFHSSQNNNNWKNIIIPDLMGIWLLFLVVANHLSN